MIRYAYAGRHYPRYLPDGQRVFHWQSVGTTSTPPPTSTHKRLYHNWLYYGGKYRNVFVWQNVGSSAGPPPTPSTHKRLYHNWYYYGGVCSRVRVWQNAGSSVTPPPSGLPNQFTVEVQGVIGLLLWKSKA